MKKILLALSIFSFMMAQAQLELEQLLSKPVSSDGVFLTNPWVGGLNSIQISPIDLNFDGILDLFVYDLEGGKKLTFINGGTPGEVDYKFAPEYIAAFDMPIEHFVQAKDYNNDNQNDLFVSHNGGMKVYKNIGSDKTGLKFEEIKYRDDNIYLMARYTNFYSNLYVARGDVPAIVDVDYDGDLDILSFANTGGTVYFYINLAADSGDLEKMNFVLSTSCWGNFEEDINSDAITLGINCKGFNGPPPPIKNKGNKHAGSTLLAFDADGDNDMDMLVGDILSRELTFLENGGDSLFANMISQTTNFPEARPIDMRIYPAAFFLDLNNDSKRDLIVTPNTLNAVENFASVWYFKNTGTDNKPTFVPDRKDFLQDGMIELGEGAHPAFYDYNDDSIPDLFIGNSGRFNGVNLPISSIYQLKANEDFSFEIIDTNFAGISNIILNEDLGTATLNLIPTFGDLDGDGDKDLLIGDFEGKLHYFENKKSLGQPAKFELSAIEFQDIDVGGYAAPQLFDLNNDGLLDLICGERNGILSYYQNKGSKSKPNFELITDSLGGVVVVPELSYTGFSYPFFFYSNDSLKLLCGSTSGHIFYYDQISGNLNGKFRLVSDNFGNINVGTRSTVTGTDLNNDGSLDLAIGNYSGGLTFYSTNINYSEAKGPKIGNGGKNYWDFQVTPVPSDGFVKLISQDENFIADPFNIRIFDVTGKLILKKDNTVEKEFDLRKANKGVYFLQLNNNSKTVVKEFIISNDYDL